MESNVPPPTVPMTLCATCDGLRYVPGGCCGEVKPCPACNAGVPVSPPGGPPTSTPAAASAAPRADAPVFEGSVTEGVLRPCKGCGAEVQRPALAVPMAEVLRHEPGCAVALKRAAQARREEALAVRTRTVPVPYPSVRGVGALRAARDVLLRIEALAEHSAATQRSEGREVTAQEFEDIGKAAREFLDEVGPL